MNEMKKRILIVEDAPYMREMLVEMLEAQGSDYDVVGIAVNGKEAVEKYKALKPDIVTMDVEMPYLDGFEALKQILAHDPKAVIVMLTNQKEKYTVARIIDAGAKDYIIKPVSRRVILEKMRKLRASER